MKKFLLPIAMVASVVGAQNVSAQDQTRTVSGDVLDENREAVPDAIIKVKGSTDVIAVDENGHFEATVPVGAVLVVTTQDNPDGQEFSTDGDQPLKISYVRDSQTPQDVVAVIGYGSQKVKYNVGGMTVVSDKAFKNVPMGSFTNMLQGQVAGLNVTGSSGEPGSNAILTLHGTSSIGAGTAPLIVIDGVPTTSLALQALNPNDIESATMLKDASSTAIYGSRGSNGVLMVTTRKGKKGAKPTINYGFQFGFKSLTPLHYKMMDLSQKLQYEQAAGYTNWMVSALGLANSSLEEKVAGLQPYNTDWSKELLRTGHLTVHDLNVSGSSEDGKLQYYTSFQWYKEQGMYRIGDSRDKGDQFDRKSGSLNISYTPNKWFTIGENIRVAYSNRIPTSDRNNVQSPWRARQVYNNYEPVYFNPSDPNYSKISSTYGWESDDGHVYDLTHEGLNLIEQDRHYKLNRTTLYGNATSFLEIRPVDGLTLRTQLGLQFENYRGNSFLMPGSYLDMYLNKTATGQNTVSTYNTRNIVWTNTADYTKTFAEKHFLSLLAGTEYTNNNYSVLGMSNKGYLPNGLTAFDVGSTPVSTTGNDQVTALMSYFGRAQYIYDGKYIVTGSLRRDGYSGFGDLKKWGTFYGVGIAWDMTQESFMKGLGKTVNYLKPHVSYGIAGNNQLSDLYASNATLAQTPYGGNSSYILDGAGNPKLAWETMRTLTAGFDFGMFDNRFTGTIDYYSRASVDLLGYQNISQTTGFSSYYANVGKMTNSGVEVTLNYDVIRTNDFRWSVGGNFTFNHNMINKINNDPNDSTQLYYGMSVAKKGYANGTYYMAEYAGVDKDYGNDTWYDKDGNVTNDFAQAEQKIIKGKSSNPRYYGNLNMNFNYKGVGLNFMFYYSGGNYIFNQAWASLTNGAVYQDAMAANAMDYWTEDNKNAKYAAPSTSTVYNIASTQYLQKGDYIRLRNVTLSYDLPASLLGKTKYIQAARLYFTGTNLLTFTGMKLDPEYGRGGTSSSGSGLGNDYLLNAYPQTKAITFGINVTF